MRPMEGLSQNPATLTLLDTPILPSGDLHLRDVPDRRCGQAVAARRPFRMSSSLLAGSREGLARIPSTLLKAIDGVLNSPYSNGPLPRGTTLEVMSAAVDALGPKELPREGIGIDAALKRLVEVLVGFGIDLSHPRAAAHLQPPPLLVAVAADTLASASNASLDTYDSGPSAIAVERWLIGSLAKIAGFGPKADGVLTPGGSISNLMGLLLARDAAAKRKGADARYGGAGVVSQPVVLCSELAHFSIQRACGALGLGESSVQAVPADQHRRMCPRALAEQLRGLRSDQTLVAIVATAGTTDFGSIDPLIEIARLAEAYGTWLHVDAAYGFGALFSERLAGRLDGLECAHSITVDLHKLGWQPAAASLLLVSDSTAFASLEREVAYLNPEDDKAAGYDGLLGRSLQTTRRPDAVKIVATLLAYGRQGLGEMVDICHDLATYAQERILDTPNLDLVSPVELTTVVFRYRCVAFNSKNRDSVEDGINGMLRRRLVERGLALIGRTAVRMQGPHSPERVCLKLTLLNPTTGTSHIDQLIQTVVEVGRECEQQLAEEDGR